MSIPQATVSVSGRMTRSARPVISSPVLAVVIFIVTEIMLFAAFISSYLIIKARYVNTNWLEGITLPVYATALNTGVLMLSGIMIFLSGKNLGLYKGGSDGHPEKTSPQQGAGSKMFWQVGLGMGGFFLLFQGYEWVGLLNAGHTMTSGIFLACFYLIIGCHALHVLAGVIALWYGKNALNRFKNIDQGDLSTVYSSGIAYRLKAIQVFWFFVVLIWPILYYLVYWSSGIS